MNGFWGKKVGMTQAFSDDRKVVPVTVLDLSDWKVLRVKTQENDGYSAVVMGLVRPAYKDTAVDVEWLKSPRQYFKMIREIPLEADVEAKLGDVPTLTEIFAEGDKVNVGGRTIGKGFQGVVKRHGFSGGRGSHGDNMGRSSGALSFMRTQGRVPKGKKLPGHMGAAQRTVKNLKVIKVEPTQGVLFVKGSVPGKAGTLVFVSKNG